MVRGCANSLRLGPRGADSRSPWEPGQRPHAAVALRSVLSSGATWPGPWRLLKQFHGLPHTLCVWTVCTPPFMQFLTFSSGRGTELGRSGLPGPHSTSGASAWGSGDCFLPPQKSTPSSSISLRNVGFSLSAFEMTLTEGNKLEKKIFYSTFATVSKQHSSKESHVFQPHKLLGMSW